MRHALWSKCIARVAKWIFVFLGRVSGAVRAANVLALLARLGPGCEERIAFVTSSSDALTGLLVDEILASRLAWAFKNNLLLDWGVVGQYRGILAVGLDLGNSPFATSDDLGLGALWWVSRAFGTAAMAAVGAFLGGAKGSVAAMAGPSNAHSNGLVHAEDGVAGDGALPFHGMNLQAKSLIQLLCPLFKQLQLREPANTGHGLIESSSLCSFGVDMADQLGSILSLSSRSCGSCSDNTASGGSRRLALSGGPSQNALDFGEHFDNSLPLSIGLWHGLRWLGGGAHDAVGWRAGDGSGCLSR